MRKDQLKPIMDFEQLYMYAAEQIQKLRLISENQTYLFDGSADGIEKIKVFLWNGFGAMAPCEDHAVSPDRPCGKVKGKNTNTMTGRIRKKWSCHLLKTDQRPCLGDVSGDGKNYNKE